MHDANSLDFAIERVKAKYQDQQSSDDDNDSNNDSNSNKDNSEISMALVRSSSENRVIVKADVNPVVEKFLSREYTGLVPTLQAEQEQSFDIQMGQYGITTAYKQCAYK